MSGYTPEGFNGDEERDWATDPEAPKAQMRTKEQFLGLTRGEILKLSGADLDAACALLCMDDVTWDEEDQDWMRSNGGIFRPSSSLKSAALAYESMAKRGWNRLTVESDGVKWWAAVLDGSRHLLALSRFHKTGAEARTMACVLASGKDGQDGIE